MAQAGVLRRPRVLVVEDEALVRLDLARALSESGFDVIEVGNADDALAVLSASTEVAVMITDVELFGSVDGVNLAWAVRRRWPPIHIIVVSGRHRVWELELPERCRFFPKPYDLRGVIGAVREVLE